MRESAISAGTIQAYCETEYHVHGKALFVLRIDIPCSELALAHQHHQVECSAYLTACNPFSQVLDGVANAARHAALGLDLSKCSLAFVDGMGEHPSNRWPGEASYLVFGLALEAAKAMGVRWQQNAIVWSGADGVPRLILLR
jgi:hypothetical protein